ncbi:hypothetical protein V494_04549 [Pseudogymnoascus sp. VKM F-4513 (FW-928)]|nr:hypothetical protein V494_04549 [Pseudogymnoascus sp. VKM F-4513 (FW-928)]
MAAKSPVMLLLGFGPNVGHHVSEAFAAKGYIVARASRRIKEEESTATQINIPIDLSDPESVIGVFSKLRDTHGFPSVVVYNAGAGIPPNDEKDPLSIPLANFTRDLNINTTSAFVAAHQAALGFAQLSPTASKTFIFTGNILNTTTIASLLNSGVGKSATAHIIQSAATAYKDRGYKFYYADERNSDGSPAYYKIDGAAHGMRYMQKEEDTFPIKAKKGPRRPPGYKHVEKLEERLKRVEAMLQGELRNRPAASDMEGEQSDANLPSDYSETHPRRASQESQRIWKRKRRTSTGSLSGLDPGAEQHISVLSQEPHLPSAAVLNHRPLDRSLTGASPVALSREITSLPGRDEAQLLIQETFLSFNSAFPIFDATTFQKAFESSYENNNHDTKAWRTCLNVAFALAHRFRAMKTGNSKIKDVHACGYLQNALAFVGELSMLTNELMAVQALLGMAILLQGTPNPEPGSILISIAVKLAQGMKLHRRGHQLGIAASEMEQRKRVFWLVYIYDKDISIRTHNPPAQDDDDMDVDLPIESIDLHHDRLKEDNFYINHIGLSIIQGQIYKQLLSIRAKKSPEIDRLRTAKELVITLGAWKQSIPCMHIDKFNTTHEASSFFILLHSVILKFTYFHALDTVRRLAHTADLDALCLVEARESMQLLQLLPQGDFAHVWLLLDIIISACTLMLTHVISSPTTTQHELKDLKLVEPVFTLLNFLNNTSRAQDVAMMAESLGALKKEAEVAKYAVQKHVRVDEVPGIGSKRIRSLEEFVGRIEELSSKRCVEFRATGLRGE